MLILIMALFDLVAKGVILWFYMIKTQEKVDVALGSVFSSAFLTILKVIVGVMTGSLGIISEALHSALDFGAALLTFFAVRVGDKPPDDEHHYGHAKVESVSALIETGLLFLTSAWIIYEAVKRLFFESVHVEVAWYAFAVIGISIVVDVFRSRSLMKVAKETHSQALEADALHFSSDIWSSCAVMVGLVGVYFEIPAVDAIAALVVAGVVLYTGYNLGKRTIQELVDQAPEGVTEKVVEAAAAVEGVFGVAKVRVRPAGAAFFVDISVEVDRKLALDKVREVLSEVEKNICKKVPRADVTARAVPVAPDSETVVERVQIVAANHGLFVHDVVVHSLKGKKYISFDLEVAAELSLKEAHDIATKLEGILREEFGEDTEINTHIEPLKMDVLAGVKASGEEAKLVEEALHSVVVDLRLIYEPHSVEVRKVEGKLFVSFHAYVKGETSLEEAHSEASRFEYLLRQRVPSVARAVVHLEPGE